MSVALVLPAAIFDISIQTRSAVTMGVTLLFASHALAGGLAAATDLVLPFSAGKETAEFIQRRGYADSTMVGSKYFIVSTVANYLDRPMYYAETGQFGTFSRWKAQRTAIAPADLVRTAQREGPPEPEGCRDGRELRSRCCGESVPELASFQRSIFTEERY